MAGHGTSRAVELASLAGMADTLATIKADLQDGVIGDDLTPLEAISARHVPAGLGWTRKAFSYVENATRATWLPGPIRVRPAS